MLSISDRPASSASYKRLCEVIPSGVNSPARACLGLLDHPLIVDSAQGATITDVDGNEYIDYCMSWGPLIAGHAHPTVLQAVEKRLRQGFVFGISTEIEERLARKVVELVDSIEQVRFVSSGTESTMTAARIARGFTGKNLIVKFAGNYHGHADLFLVQAGSAVLGLTPTSSSLGVPAESVKHTVCLPYNDVEACQQFFQSEEAQDLACVIVEPIAGNIGVVPGDPKFLQVLREETNRLGALLIFDEVITGFRVDLGGAQELYGIKPDLTCLGKVLGGGFPIGAIGGRTDVMNVLAPKGKVFQAGTLSGNPVACESGLQTLMLLENEGTYAELGAKADVIIRPLMELLQKQGAFACVQRAGSMFTVFFGKKQVTNMDDVQGLQSDQFAEFFRFLLARGIYIPPAQPEAWFVSTAHTQEQLEYTRDVILEWFFTTECS